MASILLLIKSMNIHRVHSHMFMPPPSKYLIVALLILALQPETFAAIMRCEDLLVDETAVYASFFQNPKLDGTVRVPTNVIFGITVPGTPGQWTVQTHSIRSLARYKNLILKLKKLSFADDPAREREVGAMLVEYLDGSERVIQFTSNHIGLISSADFAKALNLSGVLSNTSSVKSVTHLHTHPEMNNLNRQLGQQGGLSLSDPDIELFVALKEQMTNFAGRQIPFTAIVIPNCNFCGDLVFITQI